MAEAAAVLGATISIRNNILPYFSCIAQRLKLKASSSDNSNSASRRSSVAASTQQLSSTAAFGIDSASCPSPPMQLARWSGARAQRAQPFPRTSRVKASSSSSLSASPSQLWPWNGERADFWRPRALLCALELLGSMSMRWRNSNCLRSRWNDDASLCIKY